MEPVQDKWHTPSPWEIFALHETRLWPGAKIYRKRNCQYLVLNFHKKLPNNMASITINICFIPNLGAVIICSSWKLIKQIADRTPMHCNVKYVHVWLISIQPVTFEK